MQGCQRWRPVVRAVAAASRSLWLHPNQLHCAGPAVPSMPCQSSTSNISRCSSETLPHHRQVCSSSPPPISPSSAARAIAISPAHPPPCTPHSHPRPPSPHFTSSTPGDRACVVAVRSFPLLVVLLRRRIHTPVRCLCSALCEFEPPRYPGTHPPSAPALRSLAACADTISLPPPDITLSSAYCMI